MNYFPFVQIEKEGCLLRTFSPTVDTTELVWHMDKKDRIVKIENAGGWAFQQDNKLPVKLSDGDEIFIPKLTWHRVLKGDGELKILIKEL